MYRVKREGSNTSGRHGIGLLPKDETCDGLWWLHIGLAYMFSWVCIYSCRRAHDRCLGVQLLTMTDPGSHWSFERGARMKLNKSDCCHATVILAISVLNFSSLITLCLCRWLICLCHSCSTLVSPCVCLWTDLCLDVCLSLFYLSRAFRSGCAVDGCWWEILLQRRIVSRLPAKRIIHSPPPLSSSPRPRPSDPPPPPPPSRSFFCKLAVWFAFFLRL